MNNNVSFEYMIKKSVIIPSMILILISLLIISVSSNYASNTVKHYDDGNFSFDYPSDWQLIPNYMGGEYKIGWFKDWTASGGISVTPLRPGDNFDNFVNYEQEVIGFNNKVSITVGNYSGVTYSVLDSSGIPWYTAYINGGDVVYQVDVMSLKSEENSTLYTNNEYKDFKKILNSLKITYK